MPAKSRPCALARLAWQAMQQRVGVANVGRVEEGGAGDRVTRHLNERTDVAVELAGKESGNLLGREIVVCV
jgi:hypothetical protein